MEDKKFQEALQNLLIGSVLCTFGLIMINVIIPKQIKIRTFSGGGSSTGVNSKSFPTFACWIIVIAAGLLALSGLVELIRLKGKGSKGIFRSIKWKDELRAIALIVLCGLYMLLFAKIGYIAATIIVPPVMLFLLGSRDWKQYVSVYAVGAVVFVVFKYAMRVPLP